MLKMIRTYFERGAAPQSNLVMGKEFYSAADAGNLALLRTFTSANLDRNYQSWPGGHSTLHRAVINENLAMVEYLVDLGVDPGLQDENGATALMHAVELNNQRAIKFLAERSECRFGIVNKSGETTVNIALRKGKDKVALFLRDRGEDMTKSLQHALKAQNESAIEWLCTHGASPDVLDHQGYSLLIRSIVENRPTDFAKWLRLGADINSTQGNGPLLRTKSYTPIMFAMELNRSEMVKDLLLRPELKVDASGPSGMSVLAMALKVGNLQAIDTLAQMGMTVDTMETTKDGTTPLMWATQSGCLELVMRIQNQLPDSINLQDSKGWSALFFAAQRQVPDVVKFLLDRGANPDLVSRDHKFDARRIALTMRSKVERTAVAEREKAEAIIKLLA